MKKIININFHSRVIPIEETAYDILRKYVESLKKHFATEEGGDEIVNDIENRFAELFLTVSKKAPPALPMQMWKKLSPVWVVRKTLTRMKIPAQPAVHNPGLHLQMKLKPKARVVCIILKTTKCWEACAAALPLT